MTTFSASDYFKPIELPDAQLLRDSRTGEERNFSEWCARFAAAGALVFGSSIPNPGRALAVECYRAGLLGAVTLAKAQIKGYHPFRRRPQKPPGRRHR